MNIKTTTAKLTFLLIVVMQTVKKNIIYASTDEVPILSKFDNLIKSYKINVL